MARKKKMTFKLDPEWLIKEPLDFELKKYTLLDYIQKCEKRFDNFEIYPDFVELSLHLANIQSLVKENVLLLTDKKFESCDDEILLKELYPKKPRELSDIEKVELEKTIRYSGNKLFDTFNIGKSIWDITFDSVEISIKKNKEFIEPTKAYVYYFRKETETLYVWELEIKKTRVDKNSQKSYMRLIYENNPKDLTLSTILSTFSKWTTNKNFDEIPVFEAKSKQLLPLESTLVPIIKRKVLALIYQISSMKIEKNFDS
jgi:hypothetical protein